MVVISVVMAVYNDGKYLDQSISSVLNQTFKDFELIIVDDCSTDDSMILLNSFRKKDNRIKIFENKKNFGAGYSRNLAINNSIGDYVVIMDADDVCLKNRFLKQLNYMRNCNVDVLFSWVKFIDSDGIFLKNFNPDPKYFKLIKKYFFKENLTVNPSCMIKTSIIKENNYDPLFLRAQDYELWLRLIIKKYTFGVIPEYLLRYRIPNVSNYKKRIIKNRNYVYYTILLYFKNFKFFFHNFFFIKSFFKQIIFYLILNILPLCIIIKLIKIKDFLFDK